MVGLPGVPLPVPFATDPAWPRRLPHRLGPSLVIAGVVLTFGWVSTVSPLRGRIGSAPIAT